MNQFTSTLTNQTKTTNGALSYKTTNSKVLDLFSQGISSSIENKKQLIQEAYIENPILTLKTCLYQRSIREGMGNRDIYHAMIDVLLENKNKKYLKKILPHIPEIGYWKDILKTIGKSKKLDKIIIKMIKENIDTDGLLAKFLPRQGDKAKYITQALDLDHGDYRRKIVQLSKTVEQQMSKKQWSEIKYESVPSIANKKYAKAFSRNDANRREQFLSKVMTGDTTIKSSVLYPHQIVKMMSSDSMWSMQFKDNKTANALWKGLPNYMEEAHNVLSIIDTSGSMTSKATGTEGSCLDVALGLGLYFAEHNTGSYKDVWMNFSSSPSAQHLKGDTLYQKVKSMNMNNWGGSTNIDRAMDFVLTAAKKSPEDAPKMILIVSDMEFNSCTQQTQTNHEYMKEQFKALNIDIPTVVFWRVNVSSGSQPVTKDEKGAVLINGYSPTVVKSILSGDIANYTPYSAMLNILNPMYTWLDND